MTRAAVEALRRRPAAPPFSLLMTGALGRSAGALGLIGLLWLAVAWALGGQP